MPDGILVEEDSVEFMSRSNPICTGANQVKYVSVNFHFVTSQTYPNFTRYTDGQGNSNYNGYQRAKDYVNYMNIKFQTNYKMRLPCTTPQVVGSNQTAVQDIRIQYVLRGVYFHQTDKYNIDETYEWRILKEIGVNADTEINVFMLNTPSASWDGVASCQSNTADCQSNGGLGIRIWKGYKDYLSGTPPWETAKLLNHEMGHLFNIGHTWLGDACSDTPNNNNCAGLGYVTIPSHCTTPDCCDEPCEISNNLMDYNTDKGAVTPCQISRIHARMNGYGNAYVYSCGGCEPVNAFFYLPERACLSSAVPITLDGRGTWKELSYQIEITEVTAVGGSQLVGNSFNNYFNSGQIAGNVGLVYLNSLFAFKPGSIYKVKLTAFNNCGGGASFAVNWITIESAANCDRAEPNPPPSSVDRTFSTPSFAEAQRYEERPFLRIADTQLTPELSNDLRIFPNPASETLTLQFHTIKDQAYQVTLYTLMGQEIKLLTKGKSNSEGILSLNVTLPDVAAGTYIVELRAGATRQVKQLVINP